MTSAQRVPANVRIVSYLAVVVSGLVLLGLIVVGVVAFLALLDPTSSSGDDFTFLLLTIGLIAIGVISVLVGGIGMNMTSRAPLQRQRCWYAIALGLVALFIGATVGVAFT